MKRLIEGLRRPWGFRRICAYCKRDMGPAIGNYTGDTHGLCDPPCPEAIAMGWDK